MVYVYQTDFRLQYPVLDLHEAQCYLDSDDMAKYLREDSRCPKEVSNCVEKLRWLLSDTDRGHIILHTTRELTSDELMYISQFVSSQNSDGLGEGFEQQPWASYTVNTNGDVVTNKYFYDVDDEDVDDVMASFDWLTNDYIFEFKETM